VSDVSSAALDAAQNAIIVSGTSYYMSLHKADPGQTGANEGSEGRQLIKFGSSSGGSQASTDAQTWASAVGGTYPYFGIWTASSGGTYQRGGSLTSTIVVPGGAEINFPTGDILLEAA
jgi:hypothetical protein